MGTRQSEANRHSSSTPNATNGPTIVYQNHNFEFAVRLYNATYCALGHADSAHCSSVHCHDDLQNVCCYALRFVVMETEFSTHVSLENKWSSQVRKKSLLLNCLDSTGMCSIALSFNNDVRTSNCPVWENDQSFGQKPTKQEQTTDKQEQTAPRIAKWSLWIQMLGQNFGISVSQAEHVTLHVNMSDEVVPTFDIVG